MLADDRTHNAKPRIGTAGPLCPFVAKSRFTKCACIKKSETEEVKPITMLHLYQPVKAFPNKTICWES